MIELVFPDGSKRPFDDGVTGRQVAASIAKSLEKLPPDRFATAKEFGDALSTPGYTRPMTGFAATAARKRSVLPTIQLVKIPPPLPPVTNRFCSSI